MKALLIIIMQLTSVFANAESMITQERFDQILSHFEGVAAPWVKNNYQWDFVATGNWGQEWNSKSAGGSYYWPQPGMTWGVHITGWLARHPTLNADSLYFILCHELGHHIYGGGKERSADYFAPKECLRWFWSQSNFENRVLNTYKRIHRFRVWIWQKLNINIDAEKIDACRRSLILLGIQDKEFKDCDVEETLI